MGRTSTTCRRGISGTGESKSYLLNPTSKLLVAPFAHLPCMQRKGVGERLDGLRRELLEGADERHLLGWLAGMDHHEFATKARDGLDDRFQCSSFFARHPCLLAG